MSIIVEDSSKTCYKSKGLPNLNEKRTPSPLFKTLHFTTVWGVVLELEGSKAPERLQRYNLPLLAHKQTVANARMESVKIR